MKVRTLSIVALTPEEVDLNGGLIHDTECVSCSNHDWSVHVEYDKKGVLVKGVGSGVN